MTYSVKLTHKHLSSSVIIISSLIFLILASCMYGAKRTEQSVSSDETKISLAGQWNFKLDPDGVGIKEQWFSKELAGTAKLPGSLDEQGLGFKNTQKHLNHLTREYEYTGQAWYQKQVTVGQSWNDKRITLFLERCHWETQLWVDGCYVDTQNSLSVPHIYELTDWLTPGEHTLTVCVDNTPKINIGHTFGNMLWTHAITEETQTNWNGIIGKIELAATDAVWIDRVQTYPDFEKRSTKVKVTIGNITKLPVEGTLNITDLTDNTSIKGVTFTAAKEITIVEVELPFAASPTLWDEFSPKLHKLNVTLSAKAEQKNYSHRKEISYGLRNFKADGQHFRLNSRKVFLRGNLDCCNFPLTGYPPMTAKEWKDYLGIIKSYGMNHIRFHSWCPPEAALVAADELGIIFQMEPPLWDGHGLVGSDINRATFILDEVDKIVDTYGNHPSFCLMSLGNELGKGDDPYLAYLVDYLKKKDPRHLYTSTTHPMGIERKDDFFVAAGTPKGVVRGIRPLTDFSNFLADLKRPLIAHEVGQPAMYPNYNEIPKYTGHLKARNFEVFRESLKQKGMFDQAEDFRTASGALLVEIYKENIEAQLRTQNVAGFQLLALQDFSGQGTALIGILDSLCDSKGLINPQQFKRFCGPTVPLIRMKGFTWTSDETFAATAEIAHYGKSDLKEQRSEWTIKNKKEKTIAKGIFDKLDVPTGASTLLGNIEMELDEFKNAEQFTVEISLPGTKFANSWNFWVYPAETNIETPDGITISARWDEETRQTLLAGGKVLLLPGRKTLVNVEPSRWHPVFWCYQLFKQPETMGILCDPKHPGLAEFPTEFFSNWQWHDLLQNSEALVLDSTAVEFRPIVQFVPDFNKNRKVSAIFEASVGKGRLIVCTIDLQKNIASRPAAKQLLHSLLDYMSSDTFQPAHSLDVNVLDKLLEQLPTLASSNAPENMDLAVLNVRAAVNATLGKPEPWTSQADNAIALSEGFGYSVQGGIWKDAKSSAWHGSNMTINVTCPKKFEGTFYAHFHDWSNQERSAALYFTGRDMGPLARYDGDGVWVKIPVTKEISAQGQLSLNARNTGGANVMISQIVLMPKRAK